MKYKITQIFLIINICLFLIFLIDLVVFFLTDKSLNGYLTERYIYFISLTLSIIFTKLKKKYNSIILLLLLISPLIYILKSGKIGTSDEIKLNEKYSLRESISLETMPAISLYENGKILEKEISRWNSRIRINNTEYKIAEIDSAKIIGRIKSKIQIKFYKNNVMEINEFEIKKKQPLTASKQ
ncbi:hypothetical protein [Flavobacterium marginilacus]|uniref:hypothetical protein n=1 Tax=Flavobacterium marginilacus TaxID=3003256 RepID=UPI00248D57EE|nr:hypothetical protein [Flavobacterium marginilacus]